MDGSIDEEISLRVIRDEHGALVVHKKGLGTSSAARVRREAEVLEAARHPCVVELIDCSGDDASAELRTRWIGSHNLSQTPITDPVAMARMVAALANTVAELHARGITHNRIEPTHIVFDASGAPVLCGFGAATAWTSGSHDGSGDAAQRKAADVAAIGSLLREMIGDRSSSGTRKLIRLADDATDPAPARRPSARALADTAVRCVDTPRPDKTLRPRAKRPGAVAVAVPLVMAAVIAAFVAAMIRTRAPVTMVSSETIPEQHRATDNEAAGETSADGEAPLIEHKGRMYRIGQPGDRVLIGDWACSDSATAVVIRPSTREIFLFTDWARDETPIEVAPASHVPGGTDISSISVDATRCGVLQMVRPDGSRVSMTLTSSDPPRPQE